MFLTLEKKPFKKGFLQNFAMIYVQLLSYELYICEIVHIGWVPPAIQTPFLQKKR